MKENIKKVIHWTKDLFNAFSDTLNVPKGKFRVIIGCVMFLVVIVIPVLSLKERAVNSDNNIIVEDSTMLNDTYDEMINIDNSDYYEDILYPIESLMINPVKVGEWTYFIYNTEYDDGKEIIEYPALYRQNGSDGAHRVSIGACHYFEVAKNSIYYISFPYEFLDHGFLFVCRPDGKNEQLVEDELYYFKILNEEYIYYTYSYDTIGVGAAMHGLHRMDLDGQNSILLTYEIAGPNIGGSHFAFYVDNEYIYCNNIKIKIPDQETNGVIEIDVLSLPENHIEEYIYYTTNKLIKANLDGSEPIVLYAPEYEDSIIEIKKIDHDWIYFSVSASYNYKINKDGSKMEDFW